jgi:septation ring formation regulator EzrA
MEWEVIKTLWNFALTACAGLIVYFYNNVVEKQKELHKRTEDLHEHLTDKTDQLQKEIHTVKLDYVAKSEILRIEQRIDTRFNEMQTFLTTVLGVKK